METVSASEGRYLQATRILACALCVLIPAGESSAGPHLADDDLWIDNRHCNQARAKAQKVSDDPDVLYLLAICTSGDRHIERRAELLVRGLEIDPNNADLLKALAWTIRFEDPAGSGVDAATLDRHRHTLYEIAETPVDRVRALELIYEAAVTAGERLNAILATHPASVRSSEHYRVYAATQTTWRDRIAALRRAVELDIGNQRARCALGAALAWTGAQDEAWEVFAELAAEADAQPACNAAQALQYFKRGVAGTARQTLDDLPRVFHY